MQSEPYLEPEPQPQLEPVEDDMESLLQQQEDYVARRGDIRVGRVIEITEEGALVDVGLKREGFAPAQDLQQMERAQMEPIAPGDEVPVVIVSNRDDETYVEVSIYQARLEEDWLKAEQLFKSGEIYEAEVSGYNRGGLTVQFGRIRGFIPLSHIIGLPRGLGGPERRERLAAMVGQTIGLRVIEVDRRRRRLIFSQRRAYRTWQRQRRQQLLEELEVGQHRQGTVSSVTDFGAFVDLGGIEGLVHVSELSWQHVDDPREVVQVGDEVEVVVLEVDRSRERIGLSVKQAQGDPWEQAGSKYKDNQLIAGRVVRITDFGAFVELEPGIVGLLHVSELVGAPSVRPQEVLQPGDELLLKVLRVEPSRRRIGLSARRVRRDEWEQWAAEKAAREAQDAAAVGEEVAVTEPALPTEAEFPLEGLEPSAEVAGEGVAVAEPVSTAEAESPVEEPEPSAEVAGEEEAGEEQVSAGEVEHAVETADDESALGVEADVGTDSVER